MRLFASHKSFYKLYRVACKAQSHSEYARYRAGVLKKWDLLKSKGLPDKEISEVLGLSRSTYYRQKRLLKQYGLQALERRSRRPKRVRQSQISNEVRQIILSIRRANPTYGKLKIRRILIRDHGITLSESSVGRVLHVFFEQGQLSKYRASRKRRKKRHFKGHAQRWRSDCQPHALGEMVQIDHMTVSKNQRNIKHFQAWDPISKVIVAQCYSDATSRSARRFLNEVKERLPFPLKSIQVDGGSEFMKHFEQGCAENGIPLYVLPPKCPKLNGGVERGNRTFREDFYNQPLLANSLADFQNSLKKAVKKYNTYRPHQALNGDTPYEYTQRVLETTSQSHIY